MVLADEPDIEMVGQASDGAEAVARAGEFLPDIVLMDIRMPKISGIEAARAMKECAPSAKIVMLTISDEEEDLFEAIRSGASGYLLKRSAPAKLLESIKELHRGGAPMTSEIARKVIESFFKAKPAAHPQDKLTAREDEILGCLAEGLVTKEIADKLSVSYDTVRYHLKHIYDKLHVHSRTEAVIKYLG